MKKYRTPPQLAAEYGCSSETIHSHIKAGRLKAFSLSPPNCKRPRWLISPEAVAEFERTYAYQTTPKPRRSRRKTKAFTEYV